MHQTFRAVVLLLFVGGFSSLFADDDLQFAEISERRLEKNPQDEAAWARLIEARLQSRDVARAEKALSDWKAKVAKPSPNIDRLRGEVALAKNLIPEAIQAWQRYLGAEPKDAITRAQLASAHANQREWSQAIREITKVIEAQADAKDFAQRAMYRIRSRDWAGAQADITEANRLNAADPVTRQFYPAFERSREWLPAVKKIDAAIAKDNSNVSLRLDRAEWLIGMGFYDAGLDDIDTALKNEPSSIRARVWQGVVAWERGPSEKIGEVAELRFGNFSDEFRKGLRTIDANADPEVRAQFLLTHHQPILALSQVAKVDGSPAKASALVALDRLPEARVAARRTAEVRPRDAEAWLALARLELKNGNIEEALGAANRSISIKRTAAATELREEATLRLGKK